MPDEINLNGHHRATLEEIFRHPIGHNIEWHDVLSLLDKVGSVEQEQNGRLRVTVGSETEIFNEPRHNDVGVQQVVDVRRMLEGAGITPASLKKP